MSEQGVNDWFTWWYNTNVLPKRNTTPGNEIFVQALAALDYLMLDDALTVTSGVAGSNVVGVAQIGFLELG